VPYDQGVRDPRDFGPGARVTPLVVQKNGFTSSRGCAREVRAQSRGAAAKLAVVGCHSTSVAFMQRGWAGYP